MPVDILKHMPVDQGMKEYLETIEDPIQQYAMRVHIRTKCAPDIAAAIAVTHYRIHDPEGKLLQAVTGFIKSEIERMMIQKETGRLLNNT